MSFRSTSQKTAIFFHFASDPLCTFVSAARTIPGIHYAGLSAPDHDSLTAYPAILLMILTRHGDAIPQQLYYRYDPRSLYRPPSGVTPLLTWFKHQRRVYFETESIGFDLRSRPSLLIRVLRCLKRNRAYNRQ